jgi:hypothetical protein
MSEVYHRKALAPSVVGINAITFSTFLEIRDAGSGPTYGHIRVGVSAVSITSIHPFSQTLLELCAELLFYIKPLLSRE